MRDVQRSAMDESFPVHLLPILNYDITAFCRVSLIHHILECCRILQTFFQTPIKTCGRDQKLHPMFPVAIFFSRWATIHADKHGRRVNGNRRWNAETDQIILHRWEAGGRDRAVGLPVEGDTLNFSGRLNCEKNLSAT